MAGFLLASLQLPTKRGSPPKKNRHTRTYGTLKGDAFQTFLLRKTPGRSHLLFTASVNLAEPLAQGTYDGFTSCPEAICHVFVCCVSCVVLCVSCCVCVCVCAICVVLCMYCVLCGVGCGCVCVSVYVGTYVLMYLHKVYNTCINITYIYIYMYIHTYTLYLHGPKFVDFNCVLVPVCYAFSAEIRGCRIYIYSSTRNQ